MKADDSFAAKSYQRHQAHYDQYVEGGGRQANAEAWMREDTVDAWRHRRMYELLDPLLLGDPGSTWFTVGDGRLGKDAQYISAHHCSAVPSDISGTMLEIAKERGYIGQYRVENAEQLSVGNDSYDYVFCKESYHHFPRAPLALYEMLRVARKAVVLIEPNDTYLSDTVREMLFRKFVDGAKRLLGKPIPRHSFEDSGNYVYTISRVEIEKLAMGLNYPVVAFRGLSDAYRPGAEKELVAEKGKIYKKISLNIAILDLLARLRIRDYRLLAAIIFKQPPTKAVLQRLASAGYEVRNLPRNPYIDRE